MCDDKSLAEAVRSASAALNRAIREAAMVGIITEVDRHDCNQINGVRCPHFTVTLSKSL